jgi:hypothetical protein
MMRMKAADTSTPTKKLISAIVPAEFTAPGVLPSGRMLVRYAHPSPGRRARQRRSCRLRSPRWHR